MKADRSYSIWSYRVRHYSAQRIGGVFVGEHYAVELLTPDRRWRPVSYHATQAEALADRTDRQRRRAA